MAKNGEYFVIKEMHAKGMYVSHIAKELGRDPKTFKYTECSSVGELYILTLYIQAVFFTTLNLNIEMRYLKIINSSPTRAVCMSLMCL